MICDGIQSPANLGALFRICDAFGVQEIIFSERIPLHSRRFIKSARNTQEHIAFRQEQVLTETIFQLRTEGYETIGLEIATNSIPLPQFKSVPLTHIALVIGNESEGISNEVLALLPTVLHIPMFGNNSSMNVIQATAIALYELTKDE